MTIVDEVKARLDILDEVSSSVKLKRSGKNHTGVCPFHQEKTGSFVVFPGTQTWRCFGQCNMGGDIFDFVMKREGWDFDQTLRYLASKAGVELRAQNPQQRQQQEAQRAKEAVLGVVARYFNEKMSAKAPLPRHADGYSEGLLYAMYQRSFTQETLLRAQVGYYGGDWNELRGYLQYYQVDLEAPAAVAFVGFRGDVAAWGRKWNIEVAKGWVEDQKIPAMPPNMLMYAHLHRGRVVYISGRRLPAAANDPQNAEMPKSWNPPSELLGSKEVFFNQVWWQPGANEKEPKYLVVVEGQADALTLGQFSIPAVALIGSAITGSERTLKDGEDAVRTDNSILSELKRKLRDSARGKVTRIIEGLDQDNAGRKAAGELIGELSGAGIGPTQIAAVVWPEKDANAWLQAGGTAEEAAALLASAETLLEQLVAAAEPRAGKSDDEAVQKLFAELAKMNPFEIEKVRDEICERTNIRRRVFDGLLKAARRDAGKGEDGQPAYFIEGGRIFARYFDARGGETVEALCNFNAEIQGDVLRDNGQDIIREFQIRGTIGKANLPLARVKAEEFGKMEWPLSAWGSRAIIEAGARRRDQLRAAIQHLSKHVERKTIYTHTGWREIDDGQKCKRIYLSAAGAVGGEAVDVELDNDLEYYSIPPVAQDPKQAMQLSLTLLDIAPDRISYPIWGAMFLPPLRELINVAFVLWVFGGSGAMKTTYVTLAMNHYGPRFDDKHVPANFIDTANRMEQKAFIVADAPLLIDDFAPQKDTASHNQYTQSAHRIVRAAGNLAGRGRLNADATAKTSYVPRGLVMITGEDIPTSESLVARLFVVEMNRGDVDIPKLSALQTKRDRLCHAMSGYLAWASENWAGWKETVPNQWRTYRQQAFEAGYHLRLPEAVAGLMMGIEMGLRYAMVLGVIDSKEFQARLAKGWSALREVAGAMSARVKEEKPELLFLRTIGELITQKKIYLRRASGGPTNLGADADHEHISEMMGWWDDDRLYLLPEATFNRVAKYYRDMGNTFPVRDTTLRKSLEEAGYIETESKSVEVKTEKGEVEYRTEKRRTVSRNLDGQTRRVLVVRRAKLLEIQEGTQDTER